MGGRPGKEDAPAIAMEEVEKHRTKEDGWIVLFGEVIDVTRYLPLHPGGQDILESYLGKDATSDWEQIHDYSALEKHMAHLTKLGKMRIDGGFLSRLWRRLSAPAPAATKAEEPESAHASEGPGAAEVQAGTDAAVPEASDLEPPKEKAGVQWTVEHECELPPGGVFDLQELSRWDGVNLPMCIGVCGLVLDVSSSDNFVPNFGYGKLWAGKDTTWAMATVSLKAHDANRFDFSLEDLGEAQFKALAGWYKHFQGKYRQVGTLRELRDWDFSSVVKKAEELPTPQLAQNS